MKNWEHKYLEWVHGLYLDEIPVPQELIDQLYANGFFSDTGHIQGRRQVQKATVRPIEQKSPHEIAADERVDVIYVDADEDVPNKVVVVKEKDFDTSRHAYTGGKRVKKDDWIPHKGNVLDPDPEFVEWIDSGLNGFSHIKPYKKFDLYIQQAQDWLAEATSVSKCENYDEVVDFVIEERERWTDNSLYFVDKYLNLKQGAESGGGVVNFRAWRCQAFIAYLIDCGFSIGVGKLRQVGGSSLIGGIAIKKMLCHPNMFIKFIAENKIKSEEIFNDKIKFAFYELPSVFRPTVKNDTGSSLVFAPKSKKGHGRRRDARLIVEAPYVTAINGGTPDLVLIDEIGQIDILGPMTEEGRPTMFKVVDGNMVMTRQLVMWGCVCAGTKVWTGDGRLVNIEDLQQSDGILGYDGNRISEEPITWMKPPAEKVCYRIETTGGNFIECSEDHPVLWSHNRNRKSVDGKTRKFAGFKRADEVLVGEQLAMIDDVPVFGTEELPHARLIGLMIGDGNLSRGSSPTIGSCDEYVKSFLNSNYDVNPKGSKGFITKSGDDYVAYTIRGMLPFFRKMGMYGVIGSDKRLPDELHRYDSKSLSELLAGLFDADGNIKEDGTICLTSGHVGLLEDVKWCLLRFGIKSAINKQFVKGGFTDSHTVYRLYINRPIDQIRFRDSIPVLNQDKKNRLSCVGVKPETRISFEDRGNGKGRHFVGMDDLSGMRFVRVTAVRKIGMRPVYNLTAGKTHTYLANGFITHNTGGEMDRGGAEFEAEYRSWVKAWKARDLRTGIIPVFVDCFSKPGVTKEFYEEEKNRVYAKEGADKERMRVKFHQHYPVTIDDMFLRSAKTIVPLDLIIKYEDMTLSTPRLERGGYGFFEPVFDYSSPMPEFSDVPYKIVGAKWVPTSDADDRGVVYMHRHPVPGWKDRYYQGTDPINSESGNSQMASAIWDEHLREMSAVMNFRVTQYRYCYLQCALMSFYFGQPPHLVESNVGRNLIDYLYQNGLYRTLVTNAMLPDHLQVASTDIGMRLVPVIKPRFIHVVITLIEAYGQGLKYLTFWSQLKTYVEKTTPSGNTKWGPQNLKMYNDDVIDAFGFAYVCRMAYERRFPVDTNAEPEARHVSRRMVYDPDLGRNVYRKFMVAK